MKDYSSLREARIIDKATRECVSGKRSFTNLLELPNLMRDKKGELVLDKCLFLNTSENLYLSTKQLKLIGGQLFSSRTHAWTTTTSGSQEVALVDLPWSGFVGSSRIPGWIHRTISPENVNSDTKLTIIDTQLLELKTSKQLAEAEIKPYTRHIPSVGISGFDTDEAAQRLQRRPSGKLPWVA